MTSPKESRKKTLQPCFYLGNHMYVPHLIRPGHWVSYGGKLKTMQELIVLKAKVSYEQLFVQSAPYEWVSNIRV
jgi:uncharacterized protein (DUF486 family)